MKIWWHHHLQQQLVFMSKYETQDCEQAACPSGAQLMVGSIRPRVVMAGRDGRKLINDGRNHQTLVQELLQNQNTSHTEYSQISKRSQLFLLPAKTHEFWTRIRFSLGCDGTLDPGTTWLVVSSSQRRVIVHSETSVCSRLVQTARVHESSGQIYQTESKKQWTQDVSLLLFQGFKQINESTNRNIIWLHAARPAWLKPCYLSSWSCSSGPISCRIM